MVPRLFGGKLCGKYGLHGRRGPRRTGLCGPQGVVIRWGGSVENDDFENHDSPSLFTVIETKYYKVDPQEGCSTGMHAENKQKKWTNKFFEGG